MVKNDNHPPTLERLISLLGAGYQIDEHSSKEVGDTIWLEHPAGRRASEKTLLVYQDGWVIGMRVLDESNQLRIAPDKSDEFRRFVATVPRPTWWERNSGPFYTAAAWTIIAVVMLAGVKLMDYVWTIASGR